MLLAPFVVVGRLAPSRQGYGTHQQLGLPPCTFRALFRRPCPSCGATTAWASFVRGDLSGAVRAHASATLAAALAVGAAGWLLLSALAGRWLVRPPNETGTAVAVSVVLATAVLEWLVRLTIAW